MREPWADLFNNVQQWKQQATISFGDNSHAQEQFVSQNALQSRLISPLALSGMLHKAGRSLVEMTSADFRQYAPLIRGIKSPFEQSLGELFLTYSERDWNNSVVCFRHKEFGDEDPGLTQAQFVERYGRPPWVLLNEVLQIVGMSSYRFTAPPQGLDTINYEIALQHVEDDLTIRPSELSSGEKVLLALATSLHAGTDSAQSFEFPQLLLLDEPDASLHPSMSRSLLKVISEVLVEQRGVRVVMTSHSPTTIAMAPEEALYVMGRSTSPRLKKVSTDEAINILTVGISALSVKLENRRQVFVESEYDQAIFQELSKVVKPWLQLDRSLEFVAAGKRDKGGGCDAVKRLVTELRGGGVSTVHGIIDRDHRQGAGEGIHFVSSRHSVENLALDPLLVGTLLVRQNFVTSDDLGVPGAKRSFQLLPADAPSVVQALARRLGFSGLGVPCEYLGDLTGETFWVDVAVEFLETRGHELEELYKSTFPQLNQYQDNLKRSVIMLAGADMPSFVPADLKVMLAEILTSA